MKRLGIFSALLGLFVGCSLMGCSNTAISSAKSSTDASILDLIGSDASTDVISSTDVVGTDTSTSDNGDPFTCSGSELSCFNATVSKICVDGAWQVHEKCVDPALCQDGNCIVATSCEPGKIIGCDGFGTEIHCAADGKSTSKKACDPGQLCAEGFCRKTVCTPLVPECVVEDSKKQTYKTCTPDGQGYGEVVNCKSGAQCFGGKCVSLCEANLKFISNIGCEYWTVDLDNYPDPFSVGFNNKGLNPEQIPHSIVISNPGIFDATISFEVDVQCPDGTPCVPNAGCGKNNLACEAPAPAPYALVMTDPKVPAGQTKEFKMPMMNVSGTSMLPKGVHVKSDQPIIAWQFNPFNAEGAASNDGSLLLPQNVLGKQYFPVTRPSGIQAGYVTVVAVSPGNTLVTVTPSADVAPNKDKNSILPKFPKNQPTTVLLQQYQVLNLQAAAPQLFTSGNDLTGTFIEADKPISVFGGHQEDVESYEGAATDSDNCCAEHIEEQFMPLEQWGNAVNCVKTKPRGKEKDHWIIIAGEANVAITTVPSIQGLDGITLKKPGDHVEVQTTQSFNLKATGKVQATQIIVSRGMTDTFTGDPSMQIVPSPKHYRTDYGILTPLGYADNYATVVRPAGLKIQLDGTNIPDSSFQAFGDNSFEYAYVDFTTGQHQFTATGEFGLQVYGYGSATAYSYPGGMNLTGATGKSTP